MFRKIIHIITAVSAAFSLSLLGVCAAAQQMTPSEISVCEDGGQDFCKYPLSLTLGDLSASSDSNSTAVTSGEIRLFGAIPVKEISVRYTERKKVRPGGKPFGIRLYTEGLVVADICAVPTSRGDSYPARDAGIQSGDIILSANGQRLDRSEQLTEIADRSEDTSIMIVAMRDGKKFRTSVTPANDRLLHKPRLGLWVKDSCAGIGTVTFFDDENGTFAGLGHGICDTDSGSLMPLMSGDIVPADIAGITKSAAGHPGSLLGGFSSDKAMGRIDANAECGIYGTMLEKTEGDETIETAFRQEVVRGYAQVLTTVSGDTPQLYDAEITEISYNNSNVTKNMVIKITDEKLLEKTGGIVQGMSGSPIIQNGRLVGAVTHVLINDPVYGYAIFAENMTEYNSDIVKKQKE